jgi:hypothetical protein
MHPYPDNYQLVPYKKLSSIEAKAMMDIERIKEKKLKKDREVFSL